MAHDIYSILLSRDLRVGFMVSVETERVAHFIQGRDPRRWRQLRSREAGEIRSYNTAVPERYKLLTT